MSEPAPEPKPRQTAKTEIPSLRSETTGVVVRPPLLYLACILGGVAIHALWPLRPLPAALSPTLGPLLVIGGLALFVASQMEFARAKTPVPSTRPTRRIVPTGPYRFTRNPIYLAFTLLHLGIAVWVNSAWLLLTLAGAVAVISLVMIPREERYLERHFGEEYLRYKRTVRRWI